MLEPSGPSTGATLPRQARQAHDCRQATLTDFPQIAVHLRGVGTCADMPDCSPGPAPQSSCGTHPVPLVSPSRGLIGGRITATEAVDQIAHNLNGVADAEPAFDPFPDVGGDPAGRRPARIKVGPVLRPRRNRINPLQSRNGGRPSLTLSRRPSRPRTLQHLTQSHRVRGPMPAPPVMPAGTAYPRSPGRWRAASGGNRGTFDWRPVGAAPSVCGRCAKP